MTTTTSRWLRRIGLTLVAVSSLSLYLPMVVQAQFGHTYDRYLDLFRYWFLAFWPGVWLYFKGRFQKRP